MGFFGKIFKNKQIVTIVALIVCFVILVFAYRYRVNRAINAVSVPIATRRLEPRELIDETCFETKKVAQSMISKTVITSTKDLLGDGDKVPAKYVNYNTYIPEGSMFYKSAVTTWDKMPDSPWADLLDGYTVVSLLVDSASTFGNSIFPGDKIDLYLQDKYEGKVFIGPLINGITVLAVKDQDNKFIFNRSAEQKRAKTLIFQVNDEDFLLLTKAIELSKVFPVPRSADYNPEGMTKESKFIISFIENNSEPTNDK